jgi:deoxyadenosine/deoxycytidine kinase
MSELSFGSLSRAVTVTISGEIGSGKAVLAAFLADKLEELGAVISMDLKSENKKQVMAKDDFWKDTRKFVFESKDKVTFKDKEVRFIIEV